MYKCKRIKQRKLWWFRSHFSEKWLSMNAIEPVHVLCIMCGCVYVCVCVAFHRSNFNCFAIITFQMKWNEFLYTRNLFSKFCLSLEQFETSTAPCVACSESIVFSWRVGGISHSMKSLLLLLFQESFKITYCIRSHVYLQLVTRPMKLPRNEHYEHWKVLPAKSILVQYNNNMHLY